MKKLFAGITATCLLGLGMVGCDLNPVSNDDEVKIELGDISTIAAGSTQYVTAKVDANVAITSIDISIFNNMGVEVTTSLFSVEKQNIEFGTKEKIEIGNNKDMYIKITPKTDVCNETYTLKITAVAGAASLTKPDDFSVTGGTCGPVEEVLTARNVTVGNQGASAGSALDVDAMVVYKQSEITTAIQAAVDAWFGIVSGKATIMAPANANDFAPITQNWATKNATKFLKVTADFDNVKTQSAINALWSGSGSGLLPIATGDVIVVQTASGDLRLLQIVSASDATNGSISVTGRIK